MSRDRAPLAFVSIIAFVLAGCLAFCTGQRDRLARENAALRQSCRRDSARIMLRSGRFWYAASLDTATGGGTIRAISEEKP